MSFNNCRLCGSPAAEHTRGDYYKDMRHDLPENVEKTPASHLVEVIPGTEEDFRVGCTSCKNAIGWKNSPPANPAIGFTQEMAAAARQAMMQGVRDEWNAANPT
jgi:hypothetical protein